MIEYFCLAKYLKEKLDQIFDEALQPKFKTVWCTLGYFDSCDFIIDNEFFDLFEIYKKFERICFRKNVYL